MKILLGIFLGVATLIILSTYSSGKSFFGASSTINLEKVEGLQFFFELTRHGARAPF